VPEGTGANTGFLGGLLLKSEINQGRIAPAAMASWPNPTEWFSG